MACSKTLTDKSPEQLRRQAATFAEERGFTVHELIRVALDDFIYFRRYPTKPPSPVITIERSRPGGEYHASGVPKTS